MNPAIYLAVFLPLLVVLLQQNNSKKETARRIIKSKHKEGNLQMLEFAQKFIGKECLIYTLNAQLSGVIREVSNGAILVENNGGVEAVNLDYVVRIREYPRGKSGKKKSLVLD